MAKPLFRLFRGHVRVGGDFDLVVVVVALVALAGGVDRTGCGRACLLEGVARHDTDGTDTVRGVSVGSAGSWMGMSAAEADGNVQTSYAVHDEAHNFGSLPAVLTFTASQSGGSTIPRVLLRKA